jgi:hypothetical protein
MHIIFVIAGTQFARFIVQLDVVDIDTRQLLPELLPFLTSLVRLDLNADALDAHLLAIANSHSTLVTVAIQVARFTGSLDTLANIPDLPFSKILVCQIKILDYKLSPNFDICQLLVRRGIRFSRLTFRASIRGSPPTLPDLEHLDWLLPRARNSVDTSWVLPFAQRHTHLATIRFTDSSDRLPTISYHHHQTQVSATLSLYLP